VRALDSARDGEVIGAVLKGDVDAFSLLVERYRDSCTRFAVRMLGHREDADDALQSAFIRAFRNLEKCRDRDRFGSWLFQIVVNECRTLGTRRDRRERKLVRDLNGLTHQAAEAGAESAALEEIQRALNRLDPSYREAFILRYVEDLSYQQIAEITGDGISALKMRVMRACHQLREHLEGVPSD
jgi:RNA polymerase sigma-70 factor (ECF subfamily)